MNWLTSLRMLVFSIIGGILEGFTAYEISPSHSLREGFWVSLLGIIVTAVAQYLAMGRKDAPVQSSKPKP